MTFIWKNGEFVWEPDPEGNLKQGEKGDAKEPYSSSENKPLPKEISKNYFPPEKLRVLQERYDGGIEPVTPRQFLQFEYKLPLFTRYPLAPGHFHGSDFITREELTALSMFKDDQVAVLARDVAVRMPYEQAVGPELARYLGEQPDTRREVTVYVDVVDSNTNNFGGLILENRLEPDVSRQSAEGRADAYSLPADAITELRTHGLGFRPRRIVID